MGHQIGRPIEDRQVELPLYPMAARESAGAPKITENEVSRVLVITNNAADAGIIRAGLQDARNPLFAIEWVRCLPAGLQRLADGIFDLILIDLSQSGYPAIEAFDKLFAATDTPIIIVCAEGDEDASRAAARLGSRGYISRDRFSSDLAMQSLRSTVRVDAILKAAFIENDRAKMTLNSIGDAIISTDVSGNIDYLNAAAHSLTGWSMKEARGRPIGSVMHLLCGKTRQPVQNPIDMAMQHNQAMALQADTVLIRRDGREFMLEDSTSVIHDSQGKITGAVIVFRDITAARAMAAKMEYLAQHDFLTKLPNRVLLNDRIAQAISISERNGVGLAIMFLDLDNFKQINDSLGHGVGDKLLQSVAKRLGNCVRRSDTISRQGGDEFVILLSEYRDVKDAVLTAEKIANVFARAHLIEEHELHVTASIGVSTYPADGLDGETLIKLADTAMYNAKQKGGGSYQFFNEEMNISAPDR